MGKETIQNQSARSSGTRSSVGTWPEVKPCLHRSIAGRDPLLAVDLMRQVPRFNAREDVDGLVALLKKVLDPERLGLGETVKVVTQGGSENGDVAASGPVVSPDWDFEDFAAAMRDVGLIMGSLRRHGVEPVAAWPALEPWLVEVGARTDLPPRDTLLHYTMWNPSRALRTYTDLTEEARLIEAVRMAYPALESALGQLVGLFSTPLESPDFEAATGRIVEELSRVRDAAVYTYRFVDRRVFVESIRPYFEPIHVDGRDILGPGAVAMPLFVFDHVLWSASVDEPSYVRFKEDYLPITLPHIRRIYDRFGEEGCLIDRLEPVLGSAVWARSLSPQLRRNLQGLDRIFVLLQRFRAVHLRMARQAYREPNVHQRVFSKGSGGYAPEMLEDIERLTAAARAKLTRWLRRPAAGSQDAKGEPR